MNNYTVNIKANPVYAKHIMTGKELLAIKYAFNTSFQLQLADGSVVSVEKIVRIIPKKRMVVFGIWQDKCIVGKFFFDKVRAKKHMEKDIHGIKSLTINKIPTPALLHEDTSVDKKVQVLLFDRIVEAGNLEELIQESEDLCNVMPALKSIIIELATQHVLGVLQRDLHLKNFLLTEKIIYTLDGAQIEPFPYLLTKKPSMDSLALFLSQLGAGTEAYQEILFQHYAKARGWIVKPEDSRTLLMLIKSWSDERWQRLQKKIFRDSTDYVRINKWNKSGMYCRANVGPDMHQFLDQPESAFSHQTAVILKNGRSSTVIKVALDQREYVIKRYNIKNIFHLFRRCFRHTRARKAWRLAQKLALFHVGTAKPVAYIENKYLWFRGKSYYVSEYVSGGGISDYFSKATLAEKSQMVKRVAKLFRALYALEMTHGDLKMTNIIVKENGRPVLIDFDGAIEHSSLTGLRRAWSKEIKRFLENFRGQPDVIEMFKSEIRLTEKISI